MATCAHINLASGVVENFIVADPSVDAPWEGYALVADPPSWVQIGTPWDGSNFVKPPSPAATGATSKMRMV